jgi:hypothetical protein
VAGVVVDARRRDEAGSRTAELASDPVAPV